MSKALGDDARIIFLHHSTGQNIWNGGVQPWFQRYNSEKGKRYIIEERAYPSREYGWANYPFDYWNIWIKNAGPRPHRGQDTLEILTKTYNVIVWKHCYPVSNIDEGSGNITSSHKNLATYRLQYAALREKMRAFPETRFIVWTGAALTKGATQQAAAERARAFFTWVKTEWDEPSDNIFIFDFHELETEGGLYLLNRHARSAGDSHPNDTFSAKVAPFFAQRIVDVIEGRGDSGSLTGR